MSQQLPIEAFQEQEKPGHEYVRKFLCTFPIPLLMCMLSVQWVISLQRLPYTGFVSTWDGVGLDNNLTRSGLWEM